MRGAAAILLADHHLTATVDPVGATLVTMSYRGRELLAGPGRALPAAGHHGAVLAPWPNRLGYGRYSFGGADYQLPINDADYGHAIHGLVFDRVWEVVGTSRRSATLATEIEPSRGYPFRIGVQLTYALARDRLAVHARWQNRGDGPAPFGMGFHPYLRPGDSPLAEWTLTVPAASVLATDEATRLPTTLGPVRDDDLDFRAGRAIGDVRFSRAFTDLKSTGVGWCVSVSDPAPDGLTIEVRASQPLTWVQVFTGDVPDPALARRGLAIEPMTCPPDAFRRSEDILELAPAQSGSARWAIVVPPRRRAAYEVRALPPAPSSWSSR